MFTQHRYDAREALMRARMLYYMQLGYHALGVQEPMDVRMELMADYLRGFSGQEPDPALVAAFQDFALSLKTL